MKKRYKEVYKKAFILEIKKSIGRRTVDKEFMRNALQKAFVILSKQEMLKILCEMFWHFLEIINTISIIK